MSTPSTPAAAESRTDGEVRAALGAAVTAASDSSAGVLFGVLDRPGAEPRVWAEGAVDAVTANHMLYHVPDPAAALREFRRVLRPGGCALVATNSPGHMHQLNAAIAEATGPFEQRLNEVFGIDPAEAMLRGIFGSIVWHTFVNALMVTSVDDLLAYATSFPPGQLADDAQRTHLRAVLDQAVFDGGGRMRIDTRTGAFVVGGAAP